MSIMTAVAPCVGDTDSDINAMAEARARPHNIVVDRWPSFDQNQDWSMR